MKPVVAIVGRPNVGKSTLFNRLVGRRRALVHDRPGVTRDRIIASTTAGGREFWLVDTGGISEGDVSPHSSGVAQQIDIAVSGASLLLLVFDAREGVTPADEEIVTRFRKLGKTMVGVLNKVDPGAKHLPTADFFRLGLKQWVEVSAEHGLGISAVQEQIVQHLDPVRDQDPDDVPDSAVRVAVIGRPNVGKSSLINRILCEPRLVVSDEPGTTRDAVDIRIQGRTNSFLLVDTAGVRRHARRVDRVEQLSAIQSLQAIRRADVAVLVLESVTGLTTQEERIASLAIEAGAGILLVATKWDLVSDRPQVRREFRDEVYVRAPFLAFAPVRFVSAKTGLGIDGILPAIMRIQKRRNLKFSSEQLQKVFDRVSSNSSLREGDRGIRLFGLAQANRRLNRFYLLCNRPGRVARNITRFWENQIHRELDLEGIPVEVRLRKSSTAKSLV